MNLLNWCNKVLARIVISRNLLRRLQSILNAAARFSVGKSDRFTPLLHTCWRFRMRSFSDHEYWRTGACTTLHCHRPTLPSHFNRQLMWMVQVFISLDPWIPACACRLQHIVQREFPVAAACLQGSVPFAIAVVLRCHSFCSDIFLSPPTLLEEVMFRLFDWRARVIFMRQRSAICRQIFTFFVDPQ